ncbi:MAG: hypothetical protein VX438_02285, partial [Planctomycetota bacterium]|nr:hypothetical protein [Planctomycetota bacterium]
PFKSSQTTGNIGSIQTTLDSSTALGETGTKFITPKEKTLPDCHRRNSSHPTKRCHTTGFKLIEDLHQRLVGNAYDAMLEPAVIHCQSHFTHTINSISFNQSLGNPITETAVYR